MISFIIYFSSARVNNLFQTLRFLENRESEILSESEVILVCQDRTIAIETSFYRTIQLNLGLSFYNKPMMNNWGAKLSNGKILVMMDSDRILPKNYFTDKISKIKHGEIVSCLNMEKLDKEYSDEEIELKKYESFLDPKSEDNQMHRKNAFSGNSIIFRKDYLDLGGMDERYVGYGYADNDFTRVASVGGMKFEWDRSSVEIHLHHGCENTPNYRRENLKNGLLYCKKWNLELEFGLKDLMSSLKKHPKKLF